MKKIILFFLFCFLLISCSNNKNIPSKINANSVAINDSGVNTSNIDDYLFRKDVVYVDLRPYSWVAKDGHIAGFSFFPFYDLIAHRKNDDRLFKMDVVYKDDGNKILGGEIGSFTPNFMESEMVINRLFPKDKYIFTISQSGLEGCYFLNLLIQLGYEPSKLYNVGGFSISTGFENLAYTSIENPKYLVKGNPILTDVQDITFDFMKNLTPIENNYPLNS